MRGIYNYLVNLKDKHRRERRDYAVFMGFCSSVNMDETSGRNDSIVEMILKLLKSKFCDVVWNSNLASPVHRVVYCISLKAPPLFLRLPRWVSVSYSHCQVPSTCPKASWRGITAGAAHSWMSVSTRRAASQSFHSCQASRPRWREFIA